MTENELGKILSEMYENAAVGDKVANVHLFGIEDDNDDFVDLGFDEWVEEGLITTVPDISMGD